MTPMFKGGRAATHARLDVHQPTLPRYIRRHLGDWRQSAWSERTYFFEPPHNALNQLAYVSPKASVTQWGCR